MTLHELLEKNVKLMISTVGIHEKGNIHGLIMQEVERSLILLTLEQTQNNYFKAARVLGISRSTLYRKLVQFGMSLKFRKEKKNFDT